MCAYALCVKKPDLIVMCIKILKQLHSCLKSYLALDGPVKKLLVKYALTNNKFISENIKISVL